MTLLNYPLEWINHNPGVGFTRLSMPEGEGIHTGGLFLSPQGEVWKPLDALPYQNASMRVSTREAEALEMMAGQPGFPHNWRVEMVKERRYLVRPFCKVLGQSIPKQDVTLAQVLAIEQSVRSLNQRLWEVHDSITVAVDPQSGKPFILDLSAAQPYGDKHSSSMFKADDTAMMMRFLADMGFTELVELRKQAQSLLHDERWIMKDLPESYQHVYRYDKTNQNLCVKGALHQVEDEIWVVTEEPLSGNVTVENGLTWGWSPLHTTS